MLMLLPFTLLAQPQNQSQPQGHTLSQKLVFSPHWIPQAQFAGFYVALDKGFYKEAGLDVSIVHPSADVSSLEWLESGKADVISTFLMDAIKKRVKGHELVNIAQLSQHSALMLVGMKSRGIHTVADLKGKKLGIWTSGFDDIPFAFIREKQLDMEVIRILSTVNLFLMGGIDAMTVMHYNEYDQIINSGINEDELTPFYFAEYGYDIPEDGLYCLESTLSTKRAALAEFVKATLKGWEYAALHKDYALDLVIAEMNKAHLPNNRAHQRWMIETIIEHQQPGNKAIKPGQLLPADFNKALRIIRTNANQPAIDLTMDAFYHGLAH